MHLGVYQWDQDKTKQNLSLSLFLVNTNENSGIQEKEYVKGCEEEQKEFLFLFLG